MAEQSGGQVGDDPALAIAAKALQTLPLERDLRRIAENCGDNWKSLLTYVGLKNTKIQQFKIDENALSDACFQGLVFWLGGNVSGSDPVNWSTLLTAMEEAGMAGDAREWRQKIVERCTASLDKPRDAGKSGNDKTSTREQEEPSSNVPTLATTKAFPSGPEQTKTLCDNPLIQSLKGRVMNRYKILKPSESRVRVEYVQLALLEAQPYKHHEDEEEMMKHKKGGGKKLDFLESFRSCGLKSSKVREFIDVADLLKPTSDADNRIKVVYGQAGIGKTTMLTHICRSLTSDKPMKSSYDLVLYFPLRDKAVSSAKTLSDLLSYYATADSDLDLSALRRALVNSGDKEVLFIFDGADEVQDLLSSEESGVFQDLLEGCTLPQADVIVSSRPGGLSHVMKQNVPIIYEIHGLPKLSIQNYIKEFFKSSPEKGERLWKELQDRDDLMGGAHIPMNLLIFCHIFGKGGLPPTLTDCYKQFIVEVHNRESPEKKWKRFDRCPEDVKQLLLSLGRLAYNGLMSTPSTFVFEEEEVEEAFKTTSLDKSTFKGLLHEHPSISEVYSNNRTFNFSHTTQQELFCAYYISHLPEVKEQVEFLKGNCSNPKFSMVLRFYAGLTGLADEQVVHTVLHEPGFFNAWLPFLPKASTTGHSICAGDKLSCRSHDPRLLHLFHFLYESQNSILTQSVARHLGGKSIQFVLFLTSYDTRVIAHCLKESYSFNQLHFGQHSDSEHVLSCVSSILMSDSVTRIQHLSFSVSRLTRTGGSLLKEALSSTAVEGMSLTVKRADMSAIAAVFEAPGLKTLWLSVGNVGSVSDSDLEVAQSTARNIRIKKLQVRSQASSFVLPVVKGLAANTCVEKLFLMCGSRDGDDVGVAQALATACTTNTTLKDIELFGVSPFPLMEVLCSREVPLERLDIKSYHGSDSDSDLEVAQSSARNPRIKILEVNISDSSPAAFLPVVKGLADNTCVEKLVLQYWCDGDDDCVGQALATACTTNTTLKDIQLKGVFPLPLMKVLCSREVPLERLAFESQTEDLISVSDSYLEVAQSTARNIRIKELKVGLPPLLLPVVKGLAANTCVEKLVLERTYGDTGDDGGVGQALAIACTTNTTLKDIELGDVSPFLLMEVLCSREVPLERLAFKWGDNVSVSDSDLEVAQSTARNIRIKELQVMSEPSLLLPVVKGLAANTCVEKLVVVRCRGGDDGSVGQALATACTTNTTLKDIELDGIYPVPLMKVLCSREVPLERLAVTWYRLRENPSPCTPEALETLAQDMKVKRFESNCEWSTEHCKVLADGLSRNKSLKELDLNLWSGVPDDVKDYISAKLSTLETVNVY